MKSNSQPIIGLLIFITPFLGIPGIWKNYIISFLGLMIFLHSIWPPIAKKLSSKPKPPPKIKPTVTE